MHDQNLRTRAAAANQADAPGSGRHRAPIALPPQSRILVVTLRRLGDALLTTPLIRSIRHAWPDATIDVLSFSSSAAIFRGNPDIDNLIAIPARPSFAETVQTVTRLWNRYDLAVSTQSGDRPTVFALAAGRAHVGLIASDSTKISDVFKRYALRRHALLVDNIHRVEQMLRLVDALGIERVPELVCPAGTTDTQIVPDENYAVIHAAPMFRYKQWTRDGWRALAVGLEQRGLTVVPIGGPDPAEREYLDDIWNGVAKVHQAAWPETVTLLSRARLYVGPDTSVTHLAAAAGCPTVALFGPMDPRVWGPWPVGGLKAEWAASGTIQNRGNVWLVQNPLPCLPCTFEGCDRHIASYSRCLDELTPQQVLQAVDLALANGASSPPAGATTAAV
jgi:heptosyltransferase-3